MKRYLAFAGSNYYPSGGWDDLVGQFDTLEEARTAASADLVDVGKAGYNDWAHVVDLVDTTQVCWHAHAGKWSDEEPVT